MLGFFGIRRPPGGAELRHQHELLARPTAFGQASIWAAPDYGPGPSRCTWLKVGQAVYGGTCRRYQPHRRFHPPGRGLLDVVPLRIPINGRILKVLWGQVGTSVAKLSVRFQDGSETTLPLSELVFLYPIPRSRWEMGRRPAFLIARATGGRILRKRPLFEYTLAR